MKKFDFNEVKGYLIPIIVGLVTIVSGISEKNAQKRNEELEKKLDDLNKKLEEKEKA